MRRAAVALASGLLAVAPVAATAVEPVPPAASAEWLVGLLGPEDAVVDPALGVVDVDATLDLLLGLVASGAGGDALGAVADRLAADADLHTGGTLDATFVSATAKLVLVLDAAGRDPRDAGGTDLVGLLAGRVGSDGRATDRSDLGDLSTPGSQALTVLALDRAGGDAATVLRAADALAVAACADGGVPAEFGAEPCASDPVATALGAAALAAAADAAGTDAALTAARDDALRVLLDLEAGGELDPWAAGLTATALRGSGRGAEADALADGLAALVDGCDGGASAALVAADDPLRATVGALLAGSGATLGDLDAVGVAPGTAPLDCDEADGDGAAGGAGDAGAAGDAEDAGAAGAAPDDAADAGAGRPSAAVLAATILALAVAAGLPVLRRARRRDEADRAAARGA